MKLLTGSQGAALASGLLDLPWGLQAEYKKEVETLDEEFSIWHCGEVPVVHRGRLES